MRAKNFTKETINRYALPELPFKKFTVGDVVSVVQRIFEGDKERLQSFEGDVIALHNNGISTTFTVRKIASHNIAVERIFPLYSPVISDVRLIRHGAVRRAKLYYLRKRVGKTARVKEAVKVSSRDTQKAV